MNSRRRRIAGIGLVALGLALVGYYVIDASLLVVVLTLSATASGLGKILVRLRDPWQAVLHALLAAALAGAFAFAAAFGYFLYGYTPRKPRNDSDWSTVGDSLLIVIALPLACAAAVFVLKLVLSLREHPVPNSPDASESPL